MEIVKLTQSNLSQAVGQASKVLKQGGVVVYPTETVYGLGADPFNQSAVVKVLKIKERADDKGIILLVANRQQLDRIATVVPEEEQLINKYWPGPLTLILKKSKQLSELISGGRQSIAVRQSKHHFVTELFRLYDQPLISTSANLTGQTSCYTIEEVLEQFKGKTNIPDLIIDAGRLPKKPPSTIVEIIDRQINILRQGEIVISDINNV
ncbi:threonylcarbamoyl-AMP synthase [Patescibacteria group bacterium]|nr:threonylcarbamoyl-AMP synthase [Patescibacteria group bacterium]MBU1890797.1 threonylcarbamoyl-AMP synthase [Patescibacteria group bacterium]